MHLKWTYGKETTDGTWNPDPEDDVLDTTAADEWAWMNDRDPALEEALAAFKLAAA